jgi:hypothetical protein
MLRYHFNLHECGSVLSDEEGLVLPDDEAARKNAINEARSIMAAEVRSGKLCLSCCIDIRREDGEPVASVLFKDAVSVTGL